MTLLQLLQFNEDSGRVESSGVIRVAVGKHDLPGPVHDVDRRNGERVVLLPGCLFEIDSESPVFRERRVIDLERQPECLRR